jgi:hypothetical protein
VCTVNGGEWLESEVSRAQRLDSPVQHALDDGLGLAADPDVTLGIHGAFNDSVATDFAAL